jgi:tagatose 1,6-diphosphate aldolase GatY/KbaY
MPLEGELGKAGGKEDGRESSGPGYTDPGEAVEFAAKTGVSSLAIGVGTAHGVYDREPALNTALISVLNSALGIPLVLHGASGLAEGLIQDCIDRGISKVNFATELRIAYTGAVKTYLDMNPGTRDPKKYGAPARDAVRAVVMERIRVCGAQGKSGIIDR